MKPLAIETVARLCGGRLVSGEGARLARRVCTDSRKVQPDDLFVALVGEKFDAHDFIPQVARAGIAAVIVSRLPENDPLSGCGVIVVPDTLAALQRLAREHRRLLKPLVIGITGSNGKTSTKDFTASVMSGKYHVAATAGNLNNHIGLPLTLLAMEPEQDCGIVEMGTNHPGEIGVLCSIAEPDAAIITNIGVAHIENLGSREGIAREKGTLAEAVSADGVVVLNANDDFSEAIARRSRCRVITAGVGRGEVSASLRETSGSGSRFELNFGGQSRVEAFLPVPGEHMVGNAALAAACAWHYQVAPQAIASLLADVRLTGGRMQVRQVRGVVFLDDSYNANPDSMRAGIRTLASLQATGRRIAVLGRMGELGAHAALGHREVGECAAACGLDAVFTVGDEAAQISQAAAARRPQVVARNFPTAADCAGYLRDWLREGDAVLLKGSRSAGMEEVLTHLSGA